MVRIAVVVAAALLLCACNRVFSEKPLFSATASDALVLKPGVWLEPGSPEKPCEVDIARPLVEWPSCASAFLAGADGAIHNFSRDEKTGEVTFEPIPVVLAEGDPPILQMPTEMKEGQTMYAYFGFEAAQRDADGRVIALGDIWPVLCGPPPPASESGRYLTHRLLPGFRKNPRDKDNCVTTSAKAVRNAAGPSRRWFESNEATPPSAMRWVREALPGGADMPR